MDTGLVHIYTGDGKGKTTCSVGLCVRMVGNGGKVAFIQFMKGRDSGEIQVLENLGVKVMRTPNIKKFYFSMTDEEKAICDKENKECLDFALEISKKDYDLIVLDEVMFAINSGSIKLEDVIDLIKNKNKKTELVLTGRDPKDELKELADYISFVRMDKHPFNNGVNARQGIEF